MTAVASPPSFQQINRSAWGTNSGQGGLNSMNADEVARMFMPRKSVQRSNSSSSITSNSSASSTGTVQAAPQTNGVSMSPGDPAYGTAAARKKIPRATPWPANKPEVMSSISTTRAPSISATNGATANSSLNPPHPSAVVPSQHLQQTPGNNSRPPTQPVNESNPVLYLLSMNGTFERKTISVPYFPDTLRIGRQTNAKTVPTPANGFFDSKVLSRQHAEIWTDKNGKIWIRDVKSSNGTFVNSQRLSLENRDSEPHELQTGDHLELGIDIVSEDQKTVVHHKVAAKVEHAGYLGATTNVMEMNFGDLDPANVALMIPSQGGLPMRGRTGSQTSAGSNGRLGAPASVAGGQMSIISQQRPMNFWLTPVTTEQIAKRISHELRAARLQGSDLGHADAFFGSLLSKEDIKDEDKSQAADVNRPAPNGYGITGSSPPKHENKPRFTDPPAPPPQQPLPEKPDVSRSYTFDHGSSSLKRSTTERPRSVPSVSPVRQEPASQLVTLVEALAVARKDLEDQNARIRDLEEMLQQERQARETAEELARSLESQSAEGKLNGSAKGLDEGSILDETFGPPSEGSGNRDGEVSGLALAKQKHIDPTAITASTLILEQRLEDMVAAMKEMKQKMDSFQYRAETAEAERDTERKTLAEMVESIRSEESNKKSLGAGQPKLMRTKSQSVLDNGSDTFTSTLGPLLQKAGQSNGAAHILNGEVRGPTGGALSRLPGNRGTLVQQSAPYASMIGVVLIGMGLMAYLNGWQPPKVDR